MDDIVETINHFSCFRYLLKTAKEPLNEVIVKEYHRILKTGTADSQKEWFNVGEYKKRENMVGGKETPGYLVDTCLSAQDVYKEYLRYYKIPFAENEETGAFRGADV